MRLRDIFVELLRQRGIERIGTSILKIAKSRDPIQTLAVYVAIGRANICFATGGLKKSFTLDGKLVEEPPQAYVGDCDNIIFTREELVERAQGFPYIVVDCSFFDLHTEKEKKKVLFQIKCTLGVIRDYMWDEKFVVTGIKPPEVPAVFYPSTVDFLKEKIDSGEIKRVILLDPNAESVFEGEKADCYIIGGIVDKSGNKTGLTSKIGEMLKENGIPFESKKILLRGDVIGVPDRINTIAELLLKVVLDGKEIEEAIKEVQSPLVARWRLKKELPKHTIRVDINGRPFRIVKKSLFKEFGWLNIQPKDFFVACKQLGFLVVDDELLDRMLENAVRDERKNRYILNYS